MIKRIPIVLSLAAFLVVPASGAQAASCAAEAAGGEWPMYGHDLSNTRHQDLESSIGPAEAVWLAPVWTFSARSGGGDGDFTGTPVIAGGCVYVGSATGWVFAINADSGEKVWATELTQGGAVNASVNVSGALVYVNVSRGDAPYMVALDRLTGAIAWTSDPVDTQTGSDVYGSPVVFDGKVFVGVSAGGAELSDDETRAAYRGSFVLLDAATGALLSKTYTITDPDPAFAGAAVWSTPAIDTESRVGYAGTGNPFNPTAEHANANSIIKFSWDTGEIVGHYKGTLDTYLAEAGMLPCVDVPGNPPPWYPQGLGACGQIDLDFGASPNLFTLDGRKVVGDGQKSGVYHVVDAADMSPVWTAKVAPPGAVGGIVSSAAYHDGAIFTGATPGGYAMSLSASDGGYRWVGPTADAVHYAEPLASANGVIYTVDFKGFLDAFDAATGVPLLHRPMLLGSGASPTDPMLDWGGVSVARNTVYAGVGISGLPNGYVIAFRPSTI